MHDDIILPDGDTLLKMAEEYKKVQPKQFKNRVTALGFSARKLIVREKPYDKEEVARLTLALVDSYQKSFVLLKRMAQGTQNAVTRQRLKDFLISRENALEKLSKLGLYGQNVVFSCSADTFASLPPRARLNNLLLEEASIYTNLITALPKGGSRTAIRTLESQNLRLTVGYLLTVN